MGRPPINPNDAVGRVRIVVHLVGVRHRPIKGNRMRTMTIHDARVSEIADVIVEAVSPTHKERKTMNDTTHRHYVCTNCREIFCTAKPEYEGMVDGSSCPECHIATVVAVGEIPSGSGLPPELAGFVEFGRDIIEGVRVRDERVLDLRERQVVVLERIALALENLQVGGQLPRGG